MITVSDLMELDVFHSISLVAGGKGLHRRVSWPNIAQTVSIREWLIGGDVIFLTGIGVHCTAEGLNDLIQQAVEGNAACLIIFLHDDLIPQVPQDTIAYADQLKFPLFLGTWQHLFAELIRDISGLILADQYSENMMNEMLEMLLFKPEVLPKELMASLVEKYHLEGTHRVLLAECRWDRDKAPKGEEAFRCQRQINNMLIQECKRYFKHVCYITYNNKTIFLIGEEREEDFRNFLRELQAETRRRHSRMGLFWGIGMARAGVEQFHRSYREAEKALRMVGTSGVLSFSELGIYQLLMEIPDQGLVRQYAEDTLRPLLDYDERYQKNLLQTLEYYLETNCNYVKTAQLMFVHRNTLVYKIEKIRELLDLPVERADVRNHLFNCVRIYRYCQ